MARRPRAKPRPGRRIDGPLTFEDDAELVDWIGRAIRDGRKGAIPAGMLPMFRRLELPEKGWPG